MILQFKPPRPQRTMDELIDEDEAYDESADDYSDDDDDDVDTGSVTILWPCVSEIYFITF